MDTEKIAWLLEEYKLAFRLPSKNQAENLAGAAKRLAGGAPGKKKITQNVGNAQRALRGLESTPKINVSGLTAPTKRLTGSGSGRMASVGGVGHKPPVQKGVSAAGHKANQAAQDAVTHPSQIPGMGRFKGASAPGVSHALQLLLEAHKQASYAAIIGRRKGTVGDLLKVKKQKLQKLLV